MTFATINQPAPDFDLLDQDGKSVKLSDFKGKNLIVYFYPRAMTPGCTTQACGLRDIDQELAAHNSAAVGISPDAVVKLKKFEGKYRLNFSLLSDEDHQVAESFGAWGLKKFMGKEYMGILRSTFIIDSTGQLVHVFEKVKTTTHHQDAIDWIAQNL